MASIHLDVPDSILLAAGQSPDEFAREAKFLLALKLFEIGRLSSGRAAEMSEMPRVEFCYAPADCTVVSGKSPPAQMGAEGTLSFAPLGGPLVISVDTKGQIRVSLEAQILTPIGTFEGSVSTDSSTYLEVTCGAQTRYYALQSKPFSVRFLDVEGDVDLSHDGWARHQGDSPL